MLCLGASADILYSEGYQNGEYPPDFKKMYEIEIAEGKQMKIQFTSFDLEPPNYGDCFDFVIIYDGEDVDGDGLGDDILLPETCGDKLPGILTSKSNKVQVYFESDIRVQKKGWRFVYSETQYSKSKNGKK